MAQEAQWDVDEFQKQWINIAEQVVKELMANPEIEKIKQHVRKQGHIEFEDRDQFINLVNKIKYGIIYKEFGEEGTPDYNDFQKSWQHWNKLKGADLQKPGNMFEDNIYHLLLGSTPNPDNFLKDFDVNNDT